jgi:hypothetical protein
MWGNLGWIFYWIVIHGSKKKLISKIRILGRKLIWSSVKPVMGRESKQLNMSLWIIENWKLNKFFNLFPLEKLKCLKRKQTNPIKCETENFHHPSALSIFKISFWGKIRNSIVIIFHQNHRQAWNDEHFSSEFVENCFSNWIVFHNGWLYLKLFGGILMSHLKKSFSGKFIELRCYFKL